MLAQKINFWLERILLLVLCFWGNWGLYYLVAVLGFDASFTDLKTYLPLLFIQFAICAVYLGRLPLVMPAGNPGQADKPGAGRGLNRKTLVLVLVASVLALLGVSYFDQEGLSQTALFYNLFWALLLPVFIIYVLGYPRSSVAAEQVSECADGGLADIALLFAGALFLAVSLFGTGFHTYDDAYYGFIFSSTLASPDLPVLGVDTFFGTEAPYILHPGYRTVGYEVLLALVGDLFGLSPLYLYYAVMPSVNAVTWLLATYVLFRTLSVRHPGLALLTVLLCVLFWTEGFSLGSSLRFMFWGKSLLFFVAAPLLFVCVARFGESAGPSSWLLLFLAVAATQTWSSTGLFLVPFSVGLAALVFFPLDRRFWRLSLLALVALVPVFLSMAYSLLVLSRSEIADNGLNAGIMRVQGHAFGSLGAQIATLLIVSVVPLATKFVGDARFRRMAQRLSIVAFFTVLTPFLLEWIALAVGSNFLARRLYYAFPLIAIVGLLPGIALELLRSGQVATGGRAPRVAFAVVLLALVVLGACIDRQYLFGDWWQKTEVFRLDLKEAEEARALIPDGAVVAAGDIDDILPVFPSPPKFIAVRHYLDYHRGALSEQEYWRRVRVYRMLSNKEPLANQSISSSLDKMFFMAGKLGVTTIVFQELWAKRRPESNLLEWRQAPSEEQRKFMHMLKKRLQASPYQCQTTRSGRTWVCNR